MATKTVSSNNVVVGCKLPAGLLLQLRDSNDFQVILAEHRIRGSALRVAPFVREDGAGYTEIPADFWEAWEAWAKSVRYEPFMKGFVFAQATREDAKAEAKEKSTEKTRMEQLEVGAHSGDPRAAGFAGIDKFDDK